MDEKVKKFCPNCSQHYRIPSLPSHPKGNIPLFLCCGHTICETCVINIVRFAEPIECKICHQSTEIKTKDVTLLIQNKNELYKHFPVNMFMLGELTMEVLTESDSKKENNGSCFIDLKSIIQETDNTSGQCIECGQATIKMCQQCETILCDNCFNRSHKNFVVFKNHALVNIEPPIKCNKCKHHSDKTLDYYCKDCGKSICMDCFMVGGEKSCKNHNVASMQEVVSSVKFDFGFLKTIGYENEGFLEDLNTIFPKVDETFRRLTKTAVDIGHLLYNTENGAGAVSEVTQVIADIEQHFSKLNLIIQKHKSEVIDIVTKLKRTEKESLYKAKDDITESIKKAKATINMMSVSLDPKKMKQVNLSVLLEDAKQIADCPWYLKKSDVKNETLKVAVNEDLCNLLSDYIHLEGNANSGYTLRAAAELGDDVEIPPPPVAPVYPPELPKDVRHKKKQQQQQTRQPQKFDSSRSSNPRQIPLYQQAPKFRSKAGSTTSINSVESDSSSHKSGADRFSEAFQKPLVQPVMPFAESKVPKNLHEGAQEIIYISHIVDPHNFYVQRSCHQSVVKEMLREFRNAVSSPKPSITHLQEGKLYLMFNATDNMWQRCRINSIDRKNINKPMCTVFCIDFGSTEVVSVDKLRLLQPGRVQSPPPLAINCSLFNCMPKSGSWACEDSILIQNIVNNKQAVIYIRRIQSTANFAMTLVCDVTTFEEGISLAHALVFHDRARMPNPKLHYPKLCGPSERPKLFMVNNTLKLKTVEEVTITHIMSPDKFFVREHHLQKVYEKLSEDLEQEYNPAVNNESVYLPEIGMVYVVNMEKYRPESERSSGGAWARGVALELPGRGRVRVLLADCGAALLVHWSALRPARTHFTTLRALATECHLAGVTPLNKKWSTGSVALLQRFGERILELHVEDNRNRGSLGVTLYDKSDPDNPVCVNNEMIKYKFAITFGLFRFNTSEEQENQDKPPIDESKRESKRNTKKIQILTKRESVSISEEENLNAKDKGPLRLEAKVLQYQTPSLMYMSLVHQQKTFNELFDQIQAHYSNTEPSDKIWKEAEKCCAFSEESKTWRRAVIMELQDDTAKLFYTDFAVVETVPKSQLRELTQEFEYLGDAAIKCHICGVIPAVGTEWPSLTKEYLKELLEVYKRVFITKVGNFKDKSMPVELWVYHTVQGGALDPDTSEWRCLNKKIIDQGLGIPDKSLQVAERSNVNNEDDEQLSFLNVTGSVHEWLQLEPMPTKPLISTPEIDDNTNPSSPEVCDDVNVKVDDVAVGSSNTVFISDWLPAEPLPTVEFTGVPTYIDNDGVVLLHDVRQQDTLELIRKALEVRFKKPDPKAKYAKWTIGEPCIALYFLDNRFYRGRVLEVNPETATCLVQYIDYGNEEICEFVNMRKSIALHQIPIQAHKCILTRIRPTGNQWDRTTLDYIHKSIVEKHCLIKVAGERIGDLIPIELKYDKLCINDHLVDFEMAEYTDGSKAVVRKFAPDSVFNKNISEDLKSDSEPDYIVDDDADSVGLLSALHDRSFDTKSFENTDWNLLIQEEENNSKLLDFLQFAKNNAEQLLCNVTMINDGDTLELAIVHSDEENLRYEDMFEALQKDSPSKPHLKGVYENKACIALFHEDGQWYRASIVKYSKSKGLIKVRYVDYGNSEVVAISDVREIDEEWIELPPASMQAKLYSVKINPQIDRNTIIPKLVDTFLDKGPFQTKIVKYETSLPQVELINDDGTLVYSKLISSGYLIPSCSNAID